jgi:hypothetical protein
MVLTTRIGNVALLMWAHESVLSCPCCLKLLVKSYSGKRAELCSHALSWTSEDVRAAVAGQARPG